MKTKEKSKKGDVTRYHQSGIESNQTKTVDLTLTQEEVSLVLRALGIAEMKFFELRKNYLDSVVNVRGVGNLYDTRKEADFMLELENKFSDLLFKIKEGGDA